MVIGRCDTPVLNQSCGLRMQRSPSLSTPDHFPDLVCSPCPLISTRGSRQPGSDLSGDSPNSVTESFRSLGSAFVLLAHREDGMEVGTSRWGGQRYFWSYSGLESSLNCLIQPWWGCPELNLNLSKSHSCTHRELNWVMERSMEC